MNVDRILETMNRQGVEYLLIGGMNFMLRFEGILTFDVDLWVRNTPENLSRCELALVELGAEWGRSDEDWGPVAERKTGWLATQGVYSVTSTEGAIDIFRTVQGLDEWDGCFARSDARATPSGVSYRALGLDDLLRSQESIPLTGKVEDRIRIIRKSRGPT